jgi:tRNA nucleotidyltransferase (CCA-adding enzyme)
MYAYVDVIMTCHHLLIMLDPKDPRKEANAAIASMNHTEMEEKSFSFL